MGLLARATQLIFGSSGGTGEFGQIGSQSAGSPVTTKDLATIQSLNQFLVGLYAITNNAAQPPFIEDLNSLYFLITSQLAYIFQAGIPEYDASTNYFNLVSYVQVNGVIYQSISGTSLSPNVGNTPVSSPSNWRALIDTDTAFTANSDLVVPSQKAVKTALALKAPLASPALTGSPTVPTQTPLDNSTKAASTAYADLAVGVENTRALAAEALLAPKASPALTGTPTAPTPAASDNSTKVSTTQYADRAVSNFGNSFTGAGSFSLSSGAGSFTPAVSGTIRSNYMILIRQGTGSGGGGKMALLLYSNSGTVTLTTVSNQTSITFGVSGATITLTGGNGAETMDWRAYAIL